MLEISCENCGNHICYYQKDGPGILKRLYIDRIVGLATAKDELTCSKCKQVLGTKTLYKKENRPAYRLYVGSVVKRVIRS